LSLQELDSRLPDAARHNLTQVCGNCLPPSLLGYAA
jgi:hypothetical protein